MNSIPCHHDGITPLRRNNKPNNDRTPCSSLEAKSLLHHCIKPMIRSVYSGVVSRVDKCARNCPCFRSGADKAVMHDTSIPFVLSTSVQHANNELLQRQGAAQPSSSRYATFDSDGTFPLLPSDGFVYSSAVHSGDREGSPSDVRLNPYHDDDHNNHVDNDDTCSSSTFCQHPSCPQPGEHLDSVRKNLMNLLLDDANFPTQSCTVCRTTPRGEPRFDISSSEVQTIQESQFADSNDPFVVSLSIG